MDPVVKAIKEGDDEALNAMIKAGKNLAEPNKEGWLPLHEAAYYGQLSCLKALQRGEAGSVQPGTGWHSGARDPSSWSSVLSALAAGARQGYRPIAELKPRAAHLTMPSSPAATCPGLPGQESLIPRKGMEEG